MKREIVTRLLLPKGEWLESFIRALAVAGLEIAPSSPRSLEYSFVNQSLPIVFSAIRSWEIWPTVDSPNSLTRGGFTGTDIAREQLAGTTWIFPISDLDKKAPRPYLFVGSTPNLKKRSNAVLEDLAGSRIYTSYPNTAALFFYTKGIDVEVIPRLGAIEGFWRIDPENKAILDIADTGNTMRANQIIEMQRLEPDIGIAYVESEMPERDELRVMDLRELIEIAILQRRRI